MLYYALELNENWRLRRHLLFKKKDGGNIVHIDDWIAAIVGH